MMQETFMLFRICGQPKPRDWLGKTSTKRPVLCQVRRKIDWYVTSEVRQTIDKRGHQDEVSDSSSSLWLVVGNDVGQQTAPRCQLPLNIPRPITWRHSAPLCHSTCIFRLN